MAGEVHDVALKMRESGLGLCAIYMFFDLGVEVFFLML